MEKYILVFVVFLLVACSFETLAAEKLVFTNGILIDGTGAPPVRDSTIITEGKRIKKVGTNIELPQGAKIIDLKGATILPGFINAHIHDGFNEENLKAWVQSGVTTVRDLSSRRIKEPFKIRDRLNQNNHYARLVTVGPMLTTVNGYGSLEVKSLEHARETVTDLIERGANLIKIGIEDRQGMNRWPLISREEIKAIVNTAHKYDIRVTAHVTRLNHLHLALEGDVDELAHMIYEQIDLDTIDYIIDQNIYWIPTLELWSGISQIFNSPLVKRAIENLRTFVNRGGKVALGTDYDGYSFEFQLGMPIKEMHLMSEAGMTPMEIIIAATKNVAYVCGLEKELGTIEPGKIADILVVAGNPLNDLNLLKKVRYVVHNGEIVVNNN